MNLRALREELVGAEMRFAAFNARRTCAGTGAGIASGSAAAYEWLVDPSRPTSAYYNRASLRPGATLDEALVETLPAAIRALETTPSHLDSDVAARLRGRGFAPAYALCYLACRPARARIGANAVERLVPGQADFFFDLLQLEGVEFDAQKRATKRGYYCTAQFHAYIVRAGDGRVAGWATMFVDGRSAFFGNSFVLAEFRRGGNHAALLAARQNAAAELDLEIAYTDVEFGSQSHENCERAGFRMLTVNTIWTRT